MSDIEHISWMMKTVEPALEQMARSLRFLWSQRVKADLFLYRCEIHNSIMLLLDFSMAWLQPHPLLPFQLSHIAKKCFRAQDRLMSFVCLRIPFQKTQMKSTPLLRTKSQEGEEGQTFLKHGETINVLMVHDILICNHLDVCTSWEKYYITPLKSRQTWLDMCISKHKW